MHVLLFGERALSAPELADLRASIHHRWSSAVTRNEFREPSAQHGVKLELARHGTDVARYLCQVIIGSTDDRSRAVAFEVTRGDLKTSRHNGHRTAWQILAAFAETGDFDDLTTWHEWERETKGVRAIRWSNGLHKLVEVLEQTDAEVQAVEIGGEVIWVFGPGEWYVVSRSGGARARVLEAAERGGADAVATCVRRIVDNRTSDRAARSPTQSSTPGAFRSGQLDST